MPAMSMSQDGLLAQVLAVVGPTASGKTSLAIALAERLATEIISADSMQVYRGLEIGTGAPTEEEQRRARHHFISILPPDAPFSAGRFQQEARRVVAMLNARGKVAVAAGGSGLYVRALIDGLFAGPGKDEAIRAQLHEEARTLGVPALYDRLVERDPVYAARINPNDLRRIVRALEVHAITGRPFSALHQEEQQGRQDGGHETRLTPPAHAPLRAVQVALAYPREALYARIDARVDRMMAAGFLAEVERLLEQGYEAHLLRLRSLGYPQLIAHLQGQSSLEEAVEGVKQATRRFAKRQLTWYRADPRIHWIQVDPGASPEEYVAAALGAAHGAALQATHSG